MSEENELDEIVREFLVESHENIDRLDQDLLRLERAPDDAEAIKSIFRTIHTIKGTCGFLGFGTLEGVAHAGESLLSRLRDEELCLTPAMMQTMLDMVDVIRVMLAQIEKAGKEAEADYSSLIQTLTKLAAGQEPDSPRFDHGPDADLADEPDIQFEPEPPLPTPARAPVAVAATKKAEKAAAPKITPKTTAKGPTKPEGHEDGEHAKAAEPEGRSVSDAYVRVDVGLLDKLMNLVGELVLARNQILQFVPVIDEQSFSATCQRLNLITTELQSGVMKTRMQPIGNIWDKFPRVVRISPWPAASRSKWRWRARTPSSTRPSSRPSKTLSPTWSAIASITASRRPRIAAPLARTPKAA